MCGDSEKMDQDIDLQALFVVMPLESTASGAGKVFQGEVIYFPPLLFCAPGIVKTHANFPFSWQCWAKPSWLPLLGALCLVQCSKWVPGIKFAIKCSEERHSPP